MTRLWFGAVLLLAACEFEVDHTTTTSGQADPPSGPVFEAPPAGSFNVRPLPKADGPDGWPGRETIEEMLGGEGGRWVVMALEYVVAAPCRFRVELGDRVAVDGAADWEPESPWLLGLSDDIPAGKPVTVVAAHRADEGGRRMRLLILGGEGRGTASRGEPVAVTEPAPGVSTETLVGDDHAPPWAGTFFAMVTPDISGNGFLTAGMSSGFPLAVWAHVPVEGGSSTSYNVTNGEKSVSFTSGGVGISGNGISWTIRVDGQPTAVSDYGHVAWVLRGAFDEHD